MNTQLPQSVEPQANPVADAVRAWNRFWFTPADPTVLGLMRICCGLIVFYVHLAYTFDLKEFVGPHAWADLRSINDYRHEGPWVTRPNDWSETEGVRPPARPESPEEEKYMMKWGVNPRQAYAKGYGVWSAWFMVSDPGWVPWVHACVLGILFLFTVGFCTRITSVLAWLAALSYIQRAPTSLFGMDTIIIVLLLYLMIGPSGAALSVDRLIARWWATRQMLRKQGRKGGERALAAAHPGEGLKLEGPEPRVSANLALRLLQVHVCIIYMASGLSKLQGQAWWSGTAIWGTMANPEFSPVHIPAYLSLLQFLTQHRWLWELAMGGAVIFTLWFEICFAFLVWVRPMRWVMLASAVMLHTGIALFMGLNTFSLSMITMVMSFLPTEAVHRLLRKVGRGPGDFRLVYNGRSRAQVRAAALVHAFDVWDQVELAEASGGSRGWQPHETSQAITLRPKAPSADGHPLELVSPSGEVLTGYALFERLVRSLRLLWPLALFTWVPGLNRLLQSRFPGGAAHPLPPAGPDGERRKGVGEKVRS